MIAIIERPPASSLQPAIERARALALRRGRPALLSVSWPLAEAGDLLGLVHFLGSTEESFVYWHRPGLELAAAGVCAVVQGLAGTGAVLRDGAGRELACASGREGRFAAVARLIEALFNEAIADGPRRPFATAGFRFAENGGDSPEWQAFPAAEATVPALAAVRSRGRTYGLVNVLVGPDHPGALADNVEVGFDRLARGEVSSAAHPQPPVLSRRWLPDGPAWRERVQAALDAIHAAEIEKIVLARRLELSATGPFDPLALTAVLRTRYPGCYTYLFRRGDVAFVGASPELLVRRSGRRVVSFPLAGTIKRGGTPAEAARSLLADPKERWEHALVVDAVRQALGEVSALEAPRPPTPMRAGAMLHLGTRVAGRLSLSESVIELAGHLHPTPAVGGVPWPEASVLLESLEGFDRGWYAGPVGWVDDLGNGELALALRCALLREDRATLFAGAGIVAGSTPEGELAETELKARAVLSALHG